MRRKEHLEAERPQLRSLRHQLARVRNAAFELWSITDAALEQPNKVIVPDWIWDRVSRALTQLTAAEAHLLSWIDREMRLDRDYPLTNPSVNPKEAKDYAGKVTRAVKAFGRGAKKAGVAAGRMTKIATLKTKITSEKSYQKNLIKYGKDLEVSARRVKATRAYKDAEDRISSYEERITEIKREAEVKTNPYLRTLFNP